MSEEKLRYILNFQIELIKDKELRELVRRVVEQLPRAFWERESSKIYHPPDERGTSGALLHTLRVTKVADRLLEATTYSKEEKDILRASAILHDCLRHGVDGTSEFTVKNHPYLVRPFIKERCGIESPWVDKICRIVETHMGKWGTPPFIPEVSLNTLLHLADLIAAQSDVEVKV